MHGAETQKKFENLWNRLSLLYENGLEGLFVRAMETNKWRKHREGEYVREQNNIYTFLAHKAYERG